MENNQQIEKKPVTVTSFFSQENVKKKFEEMMGKNAPAFITSVLQIVSSNDLLKNADPVSIYQSAAVAATLNLPLNNSIGFAYIVPYNQKQKDGSFKTVAQFQLGYKGFIQLAQRSGQFKTISATPVFEGQIIESNPLTGFRFDFTKKDSDTVIGYAAYFRLLNGFEKTHYMTVDELKKHGTKFSQTFKKGFGLWKDDFDSMAQKTVIKLLLSKFAPLSIEMQKAVEFDQSVIDEKGQPNYADNEQVEIDKEAERIKLMIEDCETIEDLELLQTSNPDIDIELFNKRKEELKVVGKK